MENLIVILIILIAICGALGYIYREKKKGHCCIGCPNRKGCNSHACISQKETKF